MRRTTALLIPSPWSGDENEPITHTYLAWHWLYRNTRRLRHALQLHDWQYAPALKAKRCTWCGISSAV